MMLEDDELMNAYEDTFVNDKNDQKKESKPVVKEDKPKLISFLDGKRATNIGIAISKVKCDCLTLRKALLLMKPELANITYETLESLRVALPNAEDQKSVKDFEEKIKGPVERLAPVGLRIIIVIIGRTFYL